MNLVGFSSWREVLDYAASGGPLYYKAPMDRQATGFWPVKDNGRVARTYEVRARTIKMWPPGSVGRGRIRTSDPFTADSGHLDRFSHPAQGHAPDDWHGRTNEAGRSPERRQQRAGSFVVTLSTGQTGRFHDMPRAQSWATERLTGQPPGTYAAFYRAAVGPNRTDTGAPWTEPFHVLIVDEYGRIRIGDTRAVAPLPAQHPHRSLSERRRRDDDRPISMTYGVLPPFEEFERDVHTRIDPDKGDGSVYWEPGASYPLELVDPHEIELAETFGLEEFEAERQITGRNTRVRGFRDTEQPMYAFLQFLSDRWENGDEQAGDLASSIMMTLGYEWI